MIRIIKKMLYLHLWFSYSANFNQCYIIQLFLKSRKIFANQGYTENVNLIMKRNQAIKQWNTVNH